MHWLMLLSLRRWVSALSGSARGRTSEFGNAPSKRLRQPTKPRAHVIPRYVPIFASNFSASSPSTASQNRSSKSLKVLGSPPRYSLTASSIRTTLKLELSSARLTPLRFAIPCLVMYLLSASADDPDLRQGRRLIAHPPCPQRHDQNLDTGPNCVG
jgi:hypothetical protein